MDVVESRTLPAGCMDGHLPRILGPKKYSANCPPTQTGPTVAPQDSQDDEGGGLPATQNQENVPPGGGVAEQPEDEGEEGAETAGPLT